MNGRPARWTSDMGESPHHTEPWPGSGLSPELAEIDSMMSRCARRQPVPEGLADRVFDASVELLPARRRRGGRVLRLRPARPVSISSWGRLAMAASIAIAFFTASLLTPLGGPRKLLSPDVELALLEFAGAADAELPWTLRELDDPQLGQVAHLLVTRDMTFRDLTSDLAALAADLEM